MSMDYEELIEDQDAPVSLELEELPEIESEDPRAKSPWKAFILTGLIASLFGAAGGGYGVYAGLKSQGQTSAPAPAAIVDLAPMEARLKKLSERVAAAEVVTETLAENSANQTSSAGLEPIDYSDDFSALEARLAKLEAAPKPEIDPAALKALQAAQDDGFEWPDVKALENKIAALETQTETAADGALSSDVQARLDGFDAKLKIVRQNSPQLAALIKRLEALEKAPSPKAKLEQASIIAFPKDVMIAAVQNNIEGGLLKKTLSKHIRVKDENDPIALIEGIEADIETGRFEPAVNKFERLPDPVRAAGQAWYDSVKASL